MKDTIYKGYTLHTTWLGIEIIKGGEVLHTCNTLEEAIIWIDWTENEKNL